MPLPQGYTWSPRAMESNPVPSREELDQDKETFNQTMKEWDWKNDKNLGPQGQALPTNAVGWQPNGQAFYGEGLTGWWNKVTGNIQEAYNTGKTEGLRISGLTQHAAVVAEKVKTQLTGTVNETTMKQAEQTAQDKVAQIAQDRKASAQSSDTKAELYGIAEAAKETINQALWTVLDGLGMASVKVEQTIGAGAYAIADTIQGKDINWERNFKSSRMLYSALFDATIFDEMERRIDSGMSAEFAAQEVMSQKKWTMWPETIGQAVFDPMNYVSVFTKAGKSIMVRKAAQAEFHTIANPIVEEVLRNAGKLDETKSLKYTEDLINVQKALPAVYSHVDEISKAEKSLVKGSNAYKMGNLTASGKMARLANHTSEILMHVANNSDDAAEVILGMIKSTSANKAEAAEGLAAMMNFADSPALFSQAGNDTTAMLGRIYQKYGDTWLDNIEKLKGQPTEFMKDMFAKLDEAGQDLYPTVSKMLEAEDAVKAGGKLSKEGVLEPITEEMKRLAAAAKNIPNHVKYATRMHDSSQMVVRPINKMFAGLYMGWSPGFAFRNLSNNTMQIAIDHGLGAIIGSADNMIAKAEKFHGGDIMGQFGIGSKGLIDEAAKTANKTDAISAIKKVIKETGKDAGPGQVLGEVAEINGAKRVLSKAYMQEWRRGSSAMLKAIAPELKAAGVSDDVLRKLPTLLEKHGGSVDELMGTLRSSLDSGVMDMFDDVTRIDAGYQKSMQELGVWDEYTEKVLGAATKEDAIKAADELFGNLGKQAGLSYGDGRMVQTEMDKLTRGLEMTKDGKPAKEGLSAARGMVIEARIAENDRAIQTAYKIIDEAENLEASLKTGISLKPKDFTKKIVGNWGEDAAKVRDALLDRVVKGKEELRGLKSADELQMFWKKYPEFFDGSMPAGATWDEVADRFWAGYFDQSASLWGGARDEAIGKATTYLDNIKRAGGEVPQEWYDTIREATDRAKDYDNALVGENGMIMRNQERLPYGTRTSQIAQIAQRYDIATATEKFVATDKATLKIINKHAGVTYRSLEEVPLEVAERAFAKKVGKLTDEAQSLFDEAGKFVDPNAEKYIMPHPDDIEMSTARAIHDQMDKIGEMSKWVKDDISKNFGRKQVVDKVSESALKQVEGQLKSKLAEVRLYSSRAAQEARKFTLLDYGEKTYGDIAMAYLFPYHYWYKGTYRNWLTRIVTNPDALSHYNQYKENLANIHAGMPEWWANNVNTNELFGMDSDNPLYLNLEATLWPLNGMTGTDFNDPDRRVNWWTTSLDYMNKFGPSLWTPISMMTGALLAAKGEKEAGYKWMGRIFPQSNVIKAGASLLGVANLETDPIVGFLQGGLDPYEERRVQRALATMDQESLAGNSQYTREQIQDAAYNKSGEIWDEAVKRAVRGRAGSQLTSFFMGVGFKGRTNQDMEIDKFYTDYNKLWTLSAGKNITPQEFKDGMSALKDKYPFMDTVMLARRDSDSRDAGLAYLVMSRIPPGQSSDFANASGIPPALMEKFYNDRGQIGDWTPADRARFMSGILTLSATLEIPSDMTRTEWDSAKKVYSQMNTEAKNNFGANILDMVDGYYQAKSNNKGDAYIDQHPEVQQYMDWKAQRIMGSPLLSAYYGGAEQIEGYYRSKMYADIEQKLGADVFDVIDEYNDIKTWGTPAEAKKYQAQHSKQIKQYYDLRDQWYVTIDQETAKIAAGIPDKQNAQIRQDADVTSPMVQDVMNVAQPQQQMSFEDYQNAIPDRVMNFIVDYYQTGNQIPYAAQKQLDRIAREMGTDTQTLIQNIGISMQK